jgi:hypothetical protein
MKPGEDTRYEIKGYLRAGVRQRVVSHVSTATGGKIEQATQPQIGIVEQQVWWPVDSQVQLIVLQKIVLDGKMEVE